MIILITKKRHVVKFSEIQFDLEIVNISPIHFFQLVVFFSKVGRWEVPQISKV